MARLTEGDTAPVFELKDQQGKTVTLSQFQGKKVLVYFYPKADTPGCTTQACSLRDAKEELSGHGVVVIGISPDPEANQSKFDSKYGLGFALLSDEDHSTAEAYGAWGEKSMYGKKSMGIIRSSFLIDEQGKIAKTWYKISPKDTAPKLLAELEG